MKKCKSCQTEIDVKAKKCPHCRADQRNWFRSHPILTGIIAIIVILGVIGAVSSNKSSDTPSTTTTSSKQDQSTPTSTGLMISRDAIESPLVKLGFVFTQGQSIRDGVFKGQKNYNAKKDGTNVTFQVIGATDNPLEASGTMFFGDNADENHTSFLYLGAMVNGIDSGADSWLDKSFADGFMKIKNGDTSDYNDSTTVNGREYALEIKSGTLNFATVNVDSAGK